MMTRVAIGGGQGSRYAYMGETEVREYLDITVGYYEVEEAAAAALAGAEAEVVLMNASGE
jgi:hypothetical protein